MSEALSVRVLARVWISSSSSGMACFRESMRACQGFCVSGLQVGGESVGVCGGELGQGLVPVGGDLPFDESALGLALGWWQSFLLVAFLGSFVLDVADRQLSAA